MQILVSPYEKKRDGQNRTYILKLLFGHRHWFQKATMAFKTKFNILLKRIPYVLYMKFNTNSFFENCDFVIGLQTFIV